MFSNAQITSSVKPNYINFPVRNKLKVSDTILHFVQPSILFESVKNLKSPIVEDFSTCTYGFFCREELKIEKITRMPIRLRLGSLSQCNYYEGKKQ